MWSSFNVLFETSLGSERVLPTQGYSWLVTESAVLPRRLWIKSYLSFLLLLCYPTLFQFLLKSCDPGENCPHKGRQTSIHSIKLKKWLRFMSVMHMISLKSNTANYLDKTYVGLRSYKKLTGFKCCCQITLGGNFSCVSRVDLSPLKMKPLMWNL